MVIIVLKLSFLIFLVVVGMVCRLRVVSLLLIFMKGFCEVGEVVLGYRNCLLGEF